VDGVNGVLRVSDEVVEVGGDSLVFPAFGGGDEGHFSGSEGDELAIKKIAAHGVGEGDAAGGDADGGEGVAGVKGGVGGAEFGEGAGASGIGFFVIQEAVVVADSDDVVVEDAGVYGGS